MKNIIGCDKCQVCASSRCIYVPNDDRLRWYCEKSLNGSQPCKSFSREPGAD